MGLGEAIQHFSNPVIPPLSGSQVASEYKVASHRASSLSQPVYTEIKGLLRDCVERDASISRGYLTIYRVLPGGRYPPLSHPNDVGILTPPRRSRVSRSACLQGAP